MVENSVNKDAFLPWQRVYGLFEYYPNRIASDPLLVLIRGLPGSGKTTLAGTYQGFCHYEADQYFVDAQGTYRFDECKLAEAHQWCQRHTHDALAAGYSVVVSNTFTQPFELLPYFNMALTLQVNLCLVEATGAWKSVHPVPDDIIKLMKARWYPLKAGYYVPLRGACTENTI